MSNKTIHSILAVLKPFPCFPSYYQIHSFVVASCKNRCVVSFLYTCPICSKPLKPALSFVRWGVNISSYHPDDNAHASRLTLVHGFAGMKGHFSFHFFSSQETIVKYKSEVRQQQLEKYSLGKSILLQNSKQKTSPWCLHHNLPH